MVSTDYLLKLYFSLVCKSSILSQNAYAVAYNVSEMLPVCPKTK